MKSALYASLNEKLATYTISQIRHFMVFFYAQTGRDFHVAMQETYGSKGVCKLDLRKRESWERIFALNLAAIESSGLLQYL